VEKVPRVRRQSVRTMHNPPSAAPAQELQETSAPPVETSLPTIPQQQVQQVETPATPEQIEPTLPLPASIPQAPIPEQVAPIPQPTVWTQHEIPSTLPIPAPTSLSVPTKAPQPKRSKLGYAIRDDLIKKCKQIALDEDRFVYEVVEELLEEGLARRHQQDQEI